MPAGSRDAAPLPAAPDPDARDPEVSVGDRVAAVFEVARARIAALQGPGAGPSADAGAPVRHTTAMVPGGAPQPAVEPWIVDAQRALDERTVRLDRRAEDLDRAAAQLAERAAALVALAAEITAAAGRLVPARRRGFRGWLAARRLL